MAGEVKHQWNGSILTVISDSGASSADLKGPRGDTGPRGPQGPGGVVYNDDGELIVDLSPYATRDELEYAIENNQPDLDIFATKPYVIETVYGALPNMSAYATKSDLDEKCKPFVSQTYVDLAIKESQPDLTLYATKVYVRNEIDNIDLPAYATKNYVSTEIAKAQLSGGGDGSGVDLSGYATKDDLTNVETKVDGKTILRDENGNIYSALGGYVNEGGGVNYRLGNIEIEAPNNNNGYTRGFGTIGKAWYPGCLYHFTMSFKDGDTITFDAIFEEIYDHNGKYLCMAMLEEYEELLQKTQNHISEFTPYNAKDGIKYVDGELGFEPYITADDYTSGDISDWQSYKYTEYCPDKWILTAITVKAEGYVPIDGNFIPVDGNTIYLNEEGKLTCTVDISGGSGSGDISLTNYYTKAEVDALILGLSGSGGGSDTVDIPSGEEVDY